MKKTTIWFAALLLILANPTLAEPAGLLLGLRVEGPQKTLEYSTVWIYPQGDGYNFASASQLLVPRDTGLWKVGIVSVGGESSAGEAVFATALGESKRVQVPGTVGSRKFISYLGPDFVSVFSYDRFSFEEGTDYWDLSSLETFSLDRLSEPIEITKFWGGDAMSTVEDCFHNYMKEFSERVPSLQTQTEPTAWGFERRNEHWGVCGFRSPKLREARSRSAVFPVVFPEENELPKVLGSHALLGTYIEEIQEVVPDARDAFIGPSGQPFVVLTKQQLHVFSDSKMSEPVLVIDLVNQSEAVMVQWALGAQLDRWTTEFSKCFLKEASR